MAYITPGQLCSYLGISSPSAADSVQLATFIAAAQAIIDDLHGQTFEATADSTRYFDPSRDVCGSTLYLDRPLVQITTVTNGDGVAVTTLQYVTEPRGNTPYWAIRLRSDSDLAWTYDDQYENSIAIVGRWAYSLTAPADIQLATTRLAAWLYRQKDTGVDIDRPFLQGTAA